MSEFKYAVFYTHPVSRMIKTFSFNHTTFNGAAKRLRHAKKEGKIEPYIDSYPKELKSEYEIEKWQREQRADIANPPARSSDWKKVLLRSIS